MDIYRKKENETMAEMLKALAHPVRLCMVRGLYEEGRHNVSYMESCLEVSQSGISQHLSKLKAAGIVKGTREGNEIYYDLCNEKVRDLIRVLFEEEKA
ncbi:MAG: metalloregulator ArsR/SmtB family transcription factor [Eubacterium sp.]